MCTLRSAQFLFLSLCLWPHNRLDFELQQPRRQVRKLTRCVGLLQISGRFGNTVSFDVNAINCHGPGRTNFRLRVARVFTTRPGQAVSSCVVTRTSLCMYISNIILHVRRSKMRGSRPRTVALIKAEVVVPRPYRPRAGQGLDQHHHPRACHASCPVVRVGLWFWQLTALYRIRTRSSCPSKPVKTFK